MVVVVMVVVGDGVFKDSTNVEFCRKMANIYIYIKGALFK